MTFCLQVTNSNNLNVFLSPLSVLKLNKLSENTSRIPKSLCHRRARLVGPNQDVMKELQAVITKCYVETAQAPAARVKVCVDFMCGVGFNTFTTKTWKFSVLKIDITGKNLFLIFWPECILLPKIPCKYKKFILEKLKVKFKKT